METIEQMIAKLRVNKSKPIHQQGITREFLHDVADELDDLKDRPKPVNEPRFCKNCAHYMPEVKFSDERQQIEFSKCAHPDSYELVGGTPGHCSTGRREYGHCGPYGLHWDRIPFRIVVEKAACGLEARWFGTSPAKAAPTPKRKWWRIWETA